MAVKRNVKSPEEKTDSLPIVSQFDVFDEILKKDFSNIAIRDVEDATVPFWLTTGIYAVNWILSNNLRNGIPGHRISSLAGLSGTAKTLLLILIAANNPQVEKVIIFDTENGTAGELIKFVFKSEDSKIQEMYDEQIKKIRIITINTIDCYKIKKNGELEGIRDDKFPLKPQGTEEIYYEGFTSIFNRLANKIEKLERKPLTLYGLDSVGNLSNFKEKSGAPDMGHRAHQIGAWLKDISCKLENINGTLLFTNQVYTKLNQGNPFMGGDAQLVESGGYKVDFSPSLKMLLETRSVTDELTEEEKIQQRKKAALGKIKSKISIKVVKSRYGTLGRAITFVIDFRKGLNRFSGLFNLLKDLEILKGNRTYTLEETDFSCNKDDFIEKILEYGEDRFLLIIQEKLNQLLKNINLEDEDE